MVRGIDGKVGRMRGYVGWLVENRSTLLDMFKPKYPDVLAHHVTLQAGVKDTVALPQSVEGQIVGYCDDGVGIEAYVVEIDHTTDRPGGSTYHITWSLDSAKGYKPAQSNVILKGGYQEIRPVRVFLETMFFPEITPDAL
jgi:hypothetical protein